MALTGQVTGTFPAPLKASRSISPETVRRLLIHRERKVTGGPDVETHAMASVLGHSERTPCHSKTIGCF
jgi:hypothetical protein